MSSYGYVTWVELAKDGSKTVGHRNGNARGDNVTRIWTHPQGDPVQRDSVNGDRPCPACSPKETR
jgi:hypothetical protein